MPTQLTVRMASGGPHEHRFQIEGTVDDKPVRGDIALTMENPGFDLTFYYTEGKHIICNNNIFIRSCNNNAFKNKIKIQ